MTGSQQRFRRPKGLRVSPPHRAAAPRAACVAALIAAAASATLGVQCLSAPAYASAPAHGAGHGQHEHAVPAGHPTSPSDPQGPPAPERHQHYVVPPAGNAQHHAQPAPHPENGAGAHAPEPHHPAPPNPHSSHAGGQPSHRSSRSHKSEHPTPGASGRHHADLSNRHRGASEHHGRQCGRPSHHAAVIAPRHHTPKPHASSRPSAPPGLGKRAVLPPGLTKRAVLPPGLAKHAGHGPQVHILRTNSSHAHHANSVHLPGVIHVVPQRPASRHASKPFRAHFHRPLAPPSVLAATHGASPRPTRASTAPAPRSNPAGGGQRQLASIPRRVPDRSQPTRTRTNHAPGGRSTAPGGSGSPGSSSPAARPSPTPPPSASPRPEGLLENPYKSVGLSGVFGASVGAVLVFVVAVLAMGRRRRRVH